MFTKLTIAQRLGMLVAAMLLIPILLGLFGLYTQNAILGDFATTYNDRVVCLKQLKIVGDGYAVGIVDAAHKLSAGNLPQQQFLDGLEQSHKDVKQQWGDYRATYLTEEEKRLADQVEQAMAAADRSVDQLRVIVQGRDRAALQNYIERSMYPAIDPVAKNISALVDLQLRVTAEEYAQAQDHAARSRAATILFVAIGVALGALLSIIIVRGLLLELGGEPRDVVALARRIANGDLREKLKVKTGDNDSIVASMAHMQNGLIHMVRDMQQVIQRMSANATELAAASEQVAVSAEEQTRAASSMSASVEELSVSICSVSDNTADVAKDSVSSGDLAQRGVAIIDETLATIGQVAEMARASQEKADLMSSR